jgi:hypothetical protein
LKALKYVFGVHKKMQIMLFLEKLGDIHYMKILLRGQQNTLEGFYIKFADILCISRKNVLACKQQK